VILPTSLRGILVSSVATHQIHFLKKRDHFLNTSIHSRGAAVKPDERILGPVRVGGRGAGSCRHELPKGRKSQTMARKWKLVAGLSKRAV